MFATYKAQDLLTFSRSTTGTYIGSDGLLKTAAVDEARIEYDGSGNVQGLLLEPISTNQFPQSTTFGGFTTITGGSLTAGQSPDPSGGSSAYLWIDGNTSHDQAQLQYQKTGITASSTNRWTSSIFVKKPSRSDAVSTFEMQNFFTGGTTQNVYSQWAFDTNGVLSLTTQGGDEGTTEPFNVGYDTLANGWYRIYQTFQDVSGTTNTNVVFRIYSGQRSGGGGSGDQDGSLLVYGPQLEQNHMVTSYIPTSGSEVTRQLDRAYIDVDQFGVKQDRGTFVAEVNNLKWYMNSPAASYQRVIEFGNTVNNSDRMIPLLIQTNNNFLYADVQTDNTYQLSYQYVDYADSADLPPFSAKIALRYDETSARPAQNGVLIGNDLSTSDIEGERPYRTRLALKDEANLVATGNGSGVKFHLKTLKYYPRKLALHELSLESYYGTINTTYYVTNSGTSAYAFTGGATGNNPTLDVVRGNTYAFSVNASGHPFYLTTDDGTNFSAGNYVSEYTTGVTNSRSEDNTLFWTVDASAPNTLYYQCGNHAAMKGTINITG